MVQQIPRGVQARSRFCSNAWGAILCALSCVVACAPPESGLSPSSGGSSSSITGDETQTSGESETGSTDQGELPQDPDELKRACEDRDETLSLGLTKLRRLTRRQLNNTLFELLGVAPGAADGLSPDEKLGPFENNAITPITNLLVEQVQEMAKTVAALVSSRRIDLMGCDATTEPNCAPQFVESFGEKVYRRPITAEESAALLALFELGKTNADVDHGFALLIQAFVQSPSFLYHVDVPANGLAAGTVQQVGLHTLASRLSYFLWNSMPDDILFALAQDGSLADRAVLEAQVARMLSDERAQAVIGLFHEQWLGIAGLEEKTKDTDIYPTWGPELAASMLAELGRFTSYVMRDGDGLLRTLLTANFTLPDENLLALYGASPPPGFSVGDVVTVPHRSGVLTQPAFLTKNAHFDRTSVVHRGLVVRRNVLCQTVDPPPNNVSTALPEATQVSTTRELLELHLESPSCAKCHQAIDPLGYAFEHYDPIGAYRVTDGLGAIDASGEFVKTGEDLQGSYADATEMLAMMAQADEVERCVANQWFRFALARMESLDDACSLVQLHEEFQLSGGNVRDLIIQLALSAPFLNVRSTNEVSP